MKKRKTAVVFSILALTAMTVFSGCGSKKVTSESLVKDMKAAMEKQNSMEGELSMNMTAAIENFEMKMDALFSIEALDQTSHTEGSMTLDLGLLGKQSIDMETYTVKDGDQYITYTGSEGEWTKQEITLDEAAEADITSSVSKIIDEDIAYTLDEAQEELDGKKLYILHTTVSGETLNSLMGAMGDFTSEMTDGADLSGASAEITLKVDSATSLPYIIIMDYGDSLSNAVEAEDVEVSFKEMVISITYKSFGTVKEIVVPDDVVAAAEAAGDDEIDVDVTDIFGGTDDEEEETKESEGEAENGSDQGNSGSDAAPYVDELGYVDLYDYMGELQCYISLPDEFELSEISSSNYLYFVKETEDPYEECSAIYYVYPGWEESALQEMADSHRDVWGTDEDVTDYVMSDIYTLSTQEGDAQVVCITYTLYGDIYVKAYYAVLMLNDTDALFLEIDDTGYEEAPVLVDDSNLADLFLDYTVKAS